MADQQVPQFRHNEKEHRKQTSKVELNREHQTLIIDLIRKAIADEVHPPFAGVSVLCLCI